MNTPCDTGKVRYENKVDANVAMRRTRGRRQAKHVAPNVVTVYHCTLCDGWHMSKLYRPATKIAHVFRPDALCVVLPT